MRHPFSKWFLLVGTLLLVVALASPSSAQVPPSIESALSQARIQPLSPPLPAPDFKLPTLAGGEMSLSDNKGRWVLLTFFATWCGPCKSEMPSLQQFSQQHGKQGFDVIGVSTDSSIGVVKPFARQFGLTFPIGVDTKGQVASLYKASSIPVSFLIAPSGEVVGVARGARDWSQLESTVANLVQAMPSGSDISPSYAANATPIELPSVLNPPTATYALSRNSFAPKQRFTLDVQISWAGHFEDYLLHPPQISIPEGIHQHAMTAHTGSTQGRKVVTYRFDLEAAAEGNYAIDPIELRYTPRMESEPIASRIAGPTIKVAAPLIYGFSRTTFSGILIGTLLLGLGAYFVLRPRPNSASIVSGSEGTPYDTGLALFNEAKQCRHQGDLPGFLERLYQLHQQFPPSHQSAPNYEELISQIRYAGYQPTTHELDQLQRVVELNLSHLRPDADASDRELLAQTQRKGVTS